MAKNVKKTDAVKITGDVRVILEEMRSQLTALGERVARIEAGSKIQPPVAAVVDVVPKPAVAPTPEKQEITETEILAISAALGAYLGVRVHIRQVRLLSSSAWAQQGRVLVHAHIPYIF
jgi:methylmalonyl-CoA carboxyltransferase large subunit